MLPWPTLTAEEWREKVAQLHAKKRRRTLGGPGSGNFGHAGRPGEVGGSASDGGGKEESSARRRWPEPRTDEERRQDALARAQTNPLVNSDFVIGMENDINGESRRYIAAYGEEHRAAPLPTDIERGEKKECYKNASLLVVGHPELDYAEGLARSSSTGDLVFMHAWAVTKDGTVVDPTWEEPEKGQYFGVRYDRGAYLKYLYTAKIYGVLGSTYKNYRKAIDTGGKKLRKGAGDAR